MTTAGEAISRIRNVLKTVKEDPFMTDRFIYSMIMKFAKTLIKRESLSNILYNYSSLFKEIPCLELIEVDKIEACCTDIKTGCTIKRSKDKLPKMLELNSGPVIRAVSSLDYSTKVNLTFPSIYSNMTKTSTFKYNKQKYFWLMNDYLYIPDVEWEGVRLQAMFDEDISPLLCNIDGTDECVPEQDRTINIPEYLFSEIEQMVLQQILISAQIPTDGPDDAQNVLR